DGQFNDGTGATASRQYAAGTWHPAVQVTDSHGASSTKSFTINSGNTPPTPIIDTPATGSKWIVGQLISFSGHATDPHGRTAPPSCLPGRATLPHCSQTAPTACHTHNIQDYPAVSSGSFTAPDHEYTSYLEIALTATDSGGLSTTVSLNLQPQVVKLTFATS